MKTVCTLYSRAYRVIFVAPVLGSLLALGGCAGALPAQDADFGDPRPLMNLVMAGQIEPNTPLPARADGSVTLTPLCALLGYLTAGPAIDLLLSKGADVNKPCRTLSGGDALNRALAEIAGTPNLPLDIVALAAVNRGTIPSPYTANPMYRPQDLPALYASADKLIQRGARSKTGSMSLEQIKQRVNNGIDAGNQNVAEQKERLAERNKNSIFNAETLGAVVAIAGATASNYAAQSNQRNSQAAGAAVPLAQLRPIPSSTKVTTVASSVAGLPSPNTPIQQPAQISGGLDSQKLYTYRVDSKFRGIGETEAAGCKAAEKDAADWSPTLADDNRKLLSRGSCSCTNGYSNFFGKALECTIPYKMEITSPNNPNTRSGPSAGVSK